MLADVPPIRAAARIGPRPAEVGPPRRGDDAVERLARCTHYFLLPAQDQRRRRTLPAPAAAAVTDARDRDRPAVLARSELARSTSSVPGVVASAADASCRQRPRRRRCSGAHLRVKRRTMRPHGARLLASVRSQRRPARDGRPARRPRRCPLLVASMRSVNASLSGASIAVRTLPLYRTDGPVSMTRLLTKSCPMIREEVPLPAD